MTLDHSHQKIKGSVSRAATGSRRRPPSRESRKSSTGSLFRESNGIIIEDVPEVVTNGHTESIETGDLITETSSVLSSNKSHVQRWVNSIGEVGSHRAILEEIDEDSRQPDGKSASCDGLSETNEPFIEEVEEESNVKHEKVKRKPSAFDIELAKKVQKKAENLLKNDNSGEDSLGLSFSKTDVESKEENINGHFTVEEIVDSTSTKFKHSSPERNSFKEDDSNMLYENFPVRHITHGSPTQSPNFRSSFRRTESPSPERKYTSKLTDEFWNKMRSRNQSKERTESDIKTTGTTVINIKNEQEDSKSKSMGSLLSSDTDTYKKDSEVRRSFRSISNTATSKEDSPWLKEIKSRRSSLGNKLKNDYSSVNIKIEKEDQNEFDNKRHNSLPTTINIRLPPEGKESDDDMAVISPTRTDSLNRQSRASVYGVRKTIEQRKQLPVDNSMRSTSASTGIREPKTPVIPFHEARRASVDSSCDKSKSMTNVGETSDHNSSTSSIFKSVSSPTLEAEKDLVEKYLYGSSLGSQMSCEDKVKSYESSENFALKSTDRLWRQGRPLSNIERSTVEKAKSTITNTHRRFLEDCNSRDYHNFNQSVPNFALNKSSSWRKSSNLSQITSSSDVCQDSTPDLRTNNAPTKTSISHNSGKNDEKSKSSLDWMRLIHDRRSLREKSRNDLRETSSTHSLPTRRISLQDLKSVERSEKGSSSLAPWMREVKLKPAPKFTSSNLIYTSRANDPHRRTWSKAKDLLNDEERNKMETELPHYYQKDTPCVITTIRNLENLSKSNVSETTSLERTRFGSQKQLHNRRDASPELSKPKRNVSADVVKEKSAFVSSETLSQDTDQASTGSSTDGGSTSPEMSRKHMANRIFRPTTTRVRKCSKEVYEELAAVKARIPIDLNSIDTSELNYVDYDTRDSVLQNSQASDKSFSSNNVSKDHSPDPMSLKSETSNNFIKLINETPYIEPTLQKMGSTPHSTPLSSPAQVISSVKQASANMTSNAEQSETLNSSSDSDEEQIIKHETPQMSFQEFNFRPTKIIESDVQSAKIPKSILKRKSYDNIVNPERNVKIPNWVEVAQSKSKSVNWLAFDQKREPGEGEENSWLRDVKLKKVNDTPTKQVMFDESCVDNERKSEKINQRNESPVTDTDKPMYFFGGENDTTNDLENPDSDVAITETETKEDLVEKFVKKHKSTPHWIHEAQRRKTTAVDWSSLG